MTSSTIDDLLQHAGLVNPSWTLGTAVLPDLRTPPPHRALLHATDLVADPTSMIVHHAAARGLPFGREAASLVFQRYAHRWCGIAVHALVEANQAFDLSADHCATVFHAGSPVAIAPLSLGLAGVGPEALLSSLVDDHLVPLAHSIHRVSGLGMPNLWGNMAASFALGFRMMSRSHDARQLLEVATDFMQRRPMLERGGRFEILEARGQARLFYHRTSCCHWHAVPDEGQYCTWCSRLDEAERTRRICQLMEAEVSTPHE